MANASQAKIHNQLLAGLPESDYQRLLPHLESVELTHGKVLYEIGDPIEYVYFPFQAMVSLVTQMEDGKIVEVGLVGNDGMTGIASLMGQATSSERALVQIPNGGARAKVAVVQQEFARGKEFQRFLLRYMNDLMRQISQTAACNASHTTEERLARWLLMCHDRVASMKLNLTQEFIAEMLGTRRATVNVAAITLQSGKLIDYNRGQITIIDLPGLEAFSCECYELLKKGFNGGRRNRARE
ncbi:MAG TPA: Crp/Fnr family transcriptional regulator [Pyrinomonadaceae bacterium]|jgi:CRP-like cAMP-binding protein|nr:Crp/Fnr family transcriptional regulator [Pyrinomonadaceae bacterium]